MNIISFDIEEWYIENFFFGNRKNKLYQYDAVLNDVLNILNELNLKATFFCLGEMAKHFPDVVKKIDKHHHEIGCHSNQHFWLTKLNREAVLDDTRDAINSLEQCIGKKVVSYRAPAFSIGESNMWAFEVLAQCGIKRDASIFPARRDFGGFASFKHKAPCLIIYNGYTLKEFPVSTINLFGSEVVYSGGGYFRFFPLSFIKGRMKNQAYSMTYFHIGDLLSESNKLMSKKDYEDYFKEKGTYLNRYKRYLKSNIGTKGAFNKLENLLQSTDFVNLQQADATINWSDVPSVTLFD